MKQTLRWLSAGFAAALVLAGSARAADWFPYKAEAVEPPFAADGKVSMVDYVPLPKASKKWDICVSFPHMKDAYWLGVDYGVVEEARRLEAAAATFSMSAGLAASTVTPGSAPPLWSVTVLPSLVSKV